MLQAVAVDEGGILTALEHAPDACEPVRWGKRLAAVGVTLARIDRAFLADLLADAWEHKAPKRLLRQERRRAGSPHMDLPIGGIPAV